MGMFRTLKHNVEGAAWDEMLADNFRPVQALNGRTVYLSFQDND